MLTPRSAAVLLLCCWLAAAACSDNNSPLPESDPRMADVAPRRLTNDHEQLLLLVGSDLRPGLRVAIGDKLVGRDVPGRVTWINERMATTTVAAGLEPGDYDVGFTNLDGKPAALRRVLMIRAPEARPAPSPPTPAPTPTPSPSPTATPTPTPTPSPTPHPTPAPTRAPAQETRPPQPTAAPTVPAEPTRPPVIVPGPITVTPPVIVPTAPR